VDVAEGDILFVPRLFKFRKREPRDDFKSEGVAKEIKEEGGETKEGEVKEVKEEGDVKEAPKKSKIFFYGNLLIEKKSRIIKMNEYQVMKLINKCLTQKFIFVKLTKNNVLVLLNQAEPGYENARKILLSEESCGNVPLDLADFTEITDFALINKFYGNNKSSILRYINP
jgi:predicted RNA-binding protein with PUA domain